MKADNKNVLILLATEENKIEDSGLIFYLMKRGEKTSHF
jgi:hypothetical protein